MIEGNFKNMLSMGKLGALIATEPSTTNIGLSAVGCPKP